MPLVYGLHTLETNKDQRIEQIGISEMSNLINEWLMERNRVWNSIMGTFAVRNEKWNTTPITRMKVPSAAKVQFMDEFGVAKPTIVKGYQEQGLPLFRYEEAIGFSYEALKRTTVQEYSDELARIEIADITASEFLFWFSVFYDTNWTFSSTEEDFPDVPVKAGANGDTDVYMLRGSSDPTTADHYIAQASAIDDAHDPFPTIRETLSGYVGTGGNDRIVTFVGDATNSANIQALSGFNRVDNTRFTAWGTDVTRVLVDPTADTFIGMGDTVIGEHEEGVLVIRKRNLPANYLVSFNLDAPTPIGIREDPEPSLRGLFNINAIENSGNTMLSRFRRKIGFAPVNRTSFMVTRIGNGTYAAPSPYDEIPG